ncbi:MAG: hypothetical protein COB15_02590 [Flavobacteriales bacterium]|nr:MAG: hypothetical protein COB15_02590 [Flavobacteriales bacterium]
MKTRTILMATLLVTVGFITFAFINKPVDAELVACGIDTTEIKPQIDQRTGNVYFDFGIDDLKKGPIKQELAYIVRGFKHEGFFRPITQQKLNNAETISDVIENYPSSWIKDYNSVVISTTYKGEDIIATGPDATLTKEQKNLFKIASNILINVHYQKENYNDNVQNRQMNVSLIVTPEYQAEFIGGYDKMITYLRENSLDKLQFKDFTYLPQPSISFVINEKGEVDSVELDNSSKDEEIDKILVKLIKTMPKWKPAKNSKGDYIKQKFVFDIGMDGC